MNIMEQANMPLNLDNAWIYVDPENPTMCSVQVKVPVDIVAKRKAHLKTLAEQKLAARKQLLQEQKALIEKKFAAKKAANAEKDVKSISPKTKVLPTIVIPKLKVTTARKVGVTFGPKDAAVKPVKSTLTKF